MILTVLTIILLSFIFYKFQIDQNPKLRPKVKLLVMG